MSAFLKRRLVRPILDLLRQGITPEKIALSIALGVTLGVFPVIGATTLLCALAAWALRLNQPAIQLVNYFIYPVQLALLIPMIRLGNSIFGSSQLSFSLPQIFGMIRSDTFGAIASLGTATLQGIAVWLVASPLAIAMMYYSLVPILRKVRPV